jgi:hypothetical protein
MGAEPAYLTYLFGFAVPSFPMDDSGQKCRRYPVLILMGQKMIRDAKQALDPNAYANLFLSFPHRATLEALKKIRLTAHYAPTTSLRWTRAFQQ